MLSTGTITGASLIGALAGQPLSALVSHIQAGNAYVNVHTNDGVAPINTGRETFPAVKSADSCRSRTHGDPPRT